jgi:glycerol-3-phosphate dehydrogenase
VDANEHNHQANEEVLSRRTRALLLGARASIEAAPRVAELMAREVGTALEQACLLSSSLSDESEQK